MAKVAIVMGSKSDMGVMQKAADILAEHGVESEIFVASAHRTPDKVHGIAQRVEEEFDVVIAGAGMAAHLPGVMAALVYKPVIGVPVDSSPLKGMDALLAIVQMPPGIPVATVAVNGGKNAGILALQMIALKDEKVRDAYYAFRDKQKEG